MPPSQEGDAPSSDPHHRCSPRESWKEGGFETVGFFDYAAAGIPKVLILLVYFLTIGYALGKKVFDFEEPKDEIAQKEDGQDGSQKMTPPKCSSPY